MIKQMSHDVVSRIGWAMELKAEMVDVLRAWDGREFHMAAPR